MVEGCEGICGIWILQSGLEFGFGGFPMVWMALG